MIPFLTRYSPYAVETSGLEALYPGFQIVPDGVALVTRFIATEGWIPPTPVVTGWTACCPAVSTSWNDTYSTPVTGWTAA